LFEPFKALGYFTSDVPFCLYKSDQDLLMAVSVGHAFYVYNSKKINMVYMSGHMAEKITCLQNNTDLIYTGLDSGHIVSWKKMHKVQVYEPTKPNLPVVKFLIGGDMIFSLQEGGNFTVFDLKTAKVLKKITLGFEASVLMHPVTYINKLVFAGEGKM
jgi:U3 small nucleolar RNA-associated protein 21